MRMRWQKVSNLHQKYLFNVSVFLLVICNLKFEILQDGFHDKYRSEETIKTDQL
jgi:cell division protein FtsB